MKIRTGEIVDKNKDKNVVSSVKLSKGTRVGTLKLTVNGEEQDSVPIRGLGGGSSTVIGGSVDTQALWDAINKKVDIDFFKNLFTVYDSSDIEIATNTYTRKPDNLKISVGTWTEEYLSALGKNSEGGGGGGVGTVIGIALGTGTTPIYPDDDTGIVTLPAYPTKVSQLANDSGFVTSSTLNNYVTSSYLANNFYTKAQADSKYMTIAAFESLFNALDSNGDKINHPYSSGVDSIKALVGLWTEEYLSALGQNSEGGSSGGGSVNAIKVGTNPDTYLDPVEGIIDMSNYVTTAAQRTLWTNSAHTHSNKAVLDNITAGQVAAWNNMAAIMEEDQDNIINKWNEVVDFLSTYTEADTLANLLSNKLDVEFFRRIFTVYDEDGNTIVPNTYTQVADNLKILVGAWTEEYLSALGKNSEGGGGGTGTVTSVKIASNPDVFIDPVDGIIDMSSYATTWNNKQDAISDLATIRSNASNGNTAYSWGNHANAGYAQASNTVSNVAYNTTGKKLTKTINGNTTDIVSASTLVTDGGGAKASTTITAGNGLTGGGDLSSNRTINVVSANAAITVNADNIKLNVINDYTTTTNNTIIPLAAAKGKDLNDRLAVLESWFEVDADGNIKTKDMPNGTHRGFYTESFVSALGSNSSGGGSGAGLEDVWDSLTNQQGTVITDNTKIAIAHIPDTSSTYGYLKASALNGYATQSWVNQQGFLTTHQSIYALTLKAGGTAVTTFTPNSADASLDFVAGTNISLTRGTNQISIANTYSYTLPLAASGTRGGVQIGYSESNSGTSTTRNYAVKLSSEKMYVNVPWTDTTYKLTLNGTANGASGGTSLGSFYAPTASGTANQVLISGGSNTAPSWTAQSNLSVGTAAKLGTGTTTYSAWGQTYWSSGVPQSISGNMTSVGSITPSANGNALGTTSARFNIYGTSGNFSGNVSITGTLGVTGATTLSSTLSVAGGITLTTTKKIYFGDTSHYLELDSTGFHFSHGVYSDSFVSALGANSSGGGSGTFDEEAMWEALGTTSTAKVIASSYIPNLSASKITSGTFAAARIPVATASAVGGIKVGTTLAISDGVLNQKSGIATAGTYRSVTVDTYGRVTAGTNPTTLSGYGVLADANGRYYALYGGTRLNVSLSSTNTVDLNDVVDIGSYYCTTSADAPYINNKPDSLNHAFWLWVSSSIGNNTSYLRQRLQYFDLDNVFERISSNTGTSWTAWHLVQDNLANYALTSALGNYLPLTGGTLTGGLQVEGTLYTNGFAHMIKFNVDTSRALGYGWWDTNSNTVASIVYHNTAQNIILNPIGSASVYSDAVGKYSLVVGNNKLTYNTYTILHSNNTYVSSGTGYINGTAITQTARNTYIYNSSGYGTSTTVTVNDLAASSPSAVGMIYAATDNPLGAEKWCHVWSQAWTQGSNTGWVSQIAIGTANSTGMYYRTNGSSTIVGKAWTRVLDASNYNSYSPSLTGTGASGTWGISVTGNAATATTLATPRTIWGQSFNGSADIPTTAIAKMPYVTFKNYNDDGNAGYCGRGSSTKNDIALVAYSGNQLILGSNGSALMYLSTSNKVGIGTDSPSSKLHVIGSQGWNLHSYSSISSSSFSSFYAAHGNGASGMWCGVTSTSSSSSHYVAQFRNGITSDGSGGNVVLQIAASGNVGIGTDSPSQKLHVVGNIYGSSEITAASDARKKNIISNTKFNVRDIASARSIIYEWNDDRDKDNSKKIHGGSIAQDWLGKADSFLSQDGDGYYSINYGALALCSAITIAREVVKHEDRITLLEKENARLKARVEELEERRVA